MIMAVLSVTCRFSKNMATKKVLYQILEGYLINHLLRRRVCDEKCYIFHELNVSLRKVMDFCYANTTYSCAGNDDCYYCRIFDQIKDEFWGRRISDPGYCVILHEGKRGCKCFHSCSNDNLHYDLMFQIENINLVEEMSCIAYVCQYLLLKGKRYDDVDFDRERYVAIDNFEPCVVYCQNEVPEISEFFVV